MQRCEKVKLGKQGNVEKQEEGTQYSSLIPAGPQARPLIDIISFSPTTSNVLVIIATYRQGDRGSERLSQHPTFTLQLAAHSG